MRHLHIHENQVEWPSALRRSFQRLDRLEAIKISITLEAELLDKADRNSLNKKKIEVSVCLTCSYYKQNVPG
jgi:hypothetical protein